jgi:hypothetical protein
VDGERLAGVQAVTWTLRMAGPPRLTVQLERVVSLAFQGAMERGGAT